MKITRQVQVLLAMVLFCAVQCQSETGEEDTGKRCKRGIVDSYNLNGYLTPRPMNMYICPAISLSCCSIYDQFVMFSTWKDKIKPKLEDYYRGILSMYEKLKLLDERLSAIDMKKLAETTQLSEKAQQTLFMKLALVQNENGTKLINDLILMHHSNSIYMSKLRSTFFCGICDFENHPFFQLKNKKILIDQSTCQDIATNTIEYSYYLNAKFATYLQNYSEVLSVFPDPPNNSPVKIKGFGRIKKVVSACAKAVQQNSGFENCKNYCSHFKFNANSPVIEGYQLFFSEIVQAMQKFLNAYSTNTQPNRLLSSTRKLAVETTHNIRTSNRPTNERKLQEEGFDSFNLKDLKSRKDFYDGDIIDPNFDEYVLGQMFSVQKNYDDDRQIGYVNFIKNKLNNFDTDQDFSSGDDSDIFKTNSATIVDLENFKTECQTPGMNLAKHIYNNHIDDSLLNLISHLKNKSKYKILYEKLDPALLELVNDVDNDDIKDFHRDNFLFFKDYSMALKKDEILSKRLQPTKKR